MMLEEPHKAAILNIVAIQFIKGGTKMWIKQTTTYSAGRPVTYVQLMQTVYENGRSRQRVAANLGRRENVDMEKARALARAIKEDSYLFLPDDLLELLPTRRYGETFLLNKAFEITSLRRFLEDLAHFKGLPPECVDAFFLVCAYYSFQQGEQSGESFAREYYLRNADAITPSVLRDAFLLTQHTPFIHPGLTDHYRRVLSTDAPRAFYFIATRANSSLEASKKVLISLMTDESGAPLFCKWMPGTKFCMPEEAYSKNAICIFNEFEPALFTNERLRTVRFVARAEREQLYAMLTREELAALSVEGPYLPFGEIGYRTRTLHGCRFFLLKSSRGKAPSASMRRLPRDIIISNLEFSDENVLRCFFKMDEIENIFYRIFLPEDWRFLLHYFSGSELTGTLAGIHFLRCFLDKQLSGKLHAIGLSAQDAYALYRESRIFTLECGPRRQFLHSIYSSSQMRILNLLAFG